MNYTGYSNPARSTQVIVGGVIALMMMGLGTYVVAPAYHEALTTSDTPENMTYGKLVSRGLVGNSYVRMSDVEILQEDRTADIEAMFDQLGQGMNVGQMSPQQRRQHEMMRGIQQYQIAAIAAAAPASIVPRGSDPESVDSIISIDPRNLTLCKSQLLSDGFLAGRLTVDRAAATEPVMPPGFPNIFSNSSDKTQYKFEPYSEPPSTASATAWFLFAGLGVVVGVIICGSGGPSVPCMVFFTGPSILSLAGYPLRYGRGNNITRLLYAVIGSGMVSYGYQMMVTSGKLGSIDGDEVLIAAGFVPTFMGLAAIMGASVNFASERMNISVGSSRGRRRRRKTMSMEAACSTQPLAFDIGGFYREPVLSEFTASDHEVVFDAAESGMATMGFGDVVRYDFAEGEFQGGISLSVGCRGMVVADVRHRDGYVWTRLISVLEDGVVVMNLSSNHKGWSAKRFGTAGLYTLTESEDPVEMLSPHLEQTAAMAEQRKTQVVSLNTDETGDVFRYASRCIASVKSQYGEAVVEVNNADYGRFSYPPQSVPPVPEMATELV